MPNAISKKKIGLVLGGGGARGIAHIGVLKVLLENNVRVDCVVGCSIGSIIGAYYAIHGNVDELEEMVLSYDNKMKIFRTFIDFGRPGKTILRGRKIGNFLRKNLVKGRKFGDLRTRMFIVATDFLTGEEKVFSKNDLLRPIMASISVPGIFPPVNIGGRFYMDGGVANPTPVTVAGEAGCDIAIVVDFMAKKETVKEDPSLVSVLLHAYELMRAQAFRHNAAGFSGDKILIQPVLRKTIDSFKFADVGKFIRAGEEAAKKALPDILQKINS
ncbi:hypothetical protein A2468_04185 [Candidatus Falkowbacteria bacterium RIFOXYC2_FULL_46_15]|uniref:PNPLA domain-containing protein n=1 Tax=Candidatus Falkowbacteria bacterium RIFOXYA2_FULL_47_19 TaxID=1797994 RepID=A0A1F5SMR8_9BACT|nr:MAG: hypothetical protein A2227_05335 [Candidatus Falkowbacteria bacterium RIFOXYA2_FULL_47_19]OGF35153.1 MAG: hypothetical protein A2468_04185 [Candidatus Falkowbacteria bacterium RIFOXYC2_FULL_46_15]